MANVYALLVGINDYPFKPLQGCINDVNTVKEYLTSRFPSANLLIKILTDKDQEKPSRQNIINAFSVFEKAKDDDTCFFYYSGHGSFSNAPAEFQTDNGFVQSFVCQDSRLPGGKDLMDKEMSFLVWKTMINKPNVSFVAITDCCHSGTITKVLDNSGITDRMASGDAEHVPAKPEEYLGYDISIKNESSKEEEKAFEEIFSGNNRIIKVKQGKHIHLAASRDNQTSKELIIDGMRRGAFTHSLLKTLYSYGGQISYKGLIDHTSALVKNLVPDQQPDVNMNGGLTALEKEKIFLSQESAVSNPKFLVYYDPKYSWCIKGGLVHGISKGDKVVIAGVCTSMVIAPPSPDFSVIMSKAELGTSDKTYFGSIIRQPNQALRISFAPDVSPEIRKLIQETQLPMPSSFVSLLSEGSGQYITRANYLNEAFITLPGSESPIFKPLQVIDADSAKYFLERVEIVSKWFHLQEFNNPASELTNKHYSIKLFRSVLPNNYDRSDLASFEELKEIQSLNDLYYRQQGSNWYQPAFYLSITNTTSIPLWVTNAYLGFDYGIKIDEFSTMEIAPGNEVCLNYIGGGLPVDVIKMMIDKKYQELGYNEITEYIKLFIATQKIDTDKLKQDGVDLPSTRDIDTKTFVLKGAGEENDGNTISKVAWKTETIGFKIIKPQSNCDINPGSIVNLGPITIAPHSGLKGKASISSSSHTSKSADGVSPPHAAFNNSFLEPFDLIPGTRSGMTMDVLELFDVKDYTVVTMDNPLVIQLTANRSIEEDSILPIGYDPETKLYYPIGYMSADGNIIIETLPNETASDAAITQRSFLGSIKIYFQKVIGQKLGFKYEYPRLAIVKINNELEVEYDSDKDNVEKGIAGASNILLFIHGIIGDTEGMVKCIKTPLDETGKTLGGKTDLVLAFDYENLHTKIEENGQLLKEKLEQVGLKAGHGKNLTIVSHSMGGLVSRWFIEKEGGNKIVTKLVMLGTPNNGTSLADVRDLADTILTYAINGAAFLKPWMLLISAFGKLVKGAQVTLKQMDFESPLYPILNDGTDPLIPYTIIAGNTQQIIVEYEKTGSLIIKLFKRIKKRGIYDTLDLVLFKKSNDIAVTDESINTLKGSENWKHRPIVHEVACDHLNYFLNVENLLHI